MFILLLLFNSHYLTRAPLLFDSRLFYYLTHALLHLTGHIHAMSCHVASIGTRDDKFKWAGGGSRMVVVAAFSGVIR